VRVNVTALPLIFVQIVKGSEPIFSVVKPCVLVTLPGTVTGIGCGHVLPLVVTVTAVMVFALGLTTHARLALQASRAARFANEAPMSSCLRLMMGQVTLYDEFRLVISF
jgi:hypothetical protein